MSKRQQQKINMTGIALVHIATKTLIAVNTSPWVIVAASAAVLGVGLWLCIRMNRTEGTERGD